MAKTTKSKIMRHNEECIITKYHHIAYDLEGPYCLDCGARNALLFKCKPINVQQTPTDLKEEAIKFAEWVISNNCHYITNGNNQKLWILLNISNDWLTTERLYDLFKSKQ